MAILGPGRALPPVSYYLFIARARLNSCTIFSRKPHSSADEPSGRCLAMGICGIEKMASVAPNDDFTHCIHRNTTEKGKLSGYFGLEKK
jgi:hypothetical protein